VLVVPRDDAPKVAELAGAEHERDKATRRQHYQALGKDPDQTI
jgi:hypothetical protein